MKSRRRKDPSDKAVKAVMSGGRDAPQAAAQADAHLLLSSLADALNAAEAAGFPVKLAHGAVLTPVGYVLAVYPDAGERYAVRTMALTEFPAGQDSSDED